MNRHGYGGANGHAGGGAYPMSPTFVERSGRTFSIRPDKYEKYQPRSSRSAFHRRKGLFLRLGGAIATLLLILMIFIPSLRPTALLPALSLGLFSTGEEWKIETVRYYDLANVEGTSRGWEREERILLCAPLRDAAPHLPMFFSHLKNLTYPHNLIDLAFLVGDSKDNTLTLLSDLLADLQAQSDPRATFGEISVIEKDFGQKVNQDVESRHGFAAQASRRKSMAQARNWLLSAALRPTHSWVYWRDVDVETAPFTILEDLMRHNKDIIVPNVWRPLPDWLGGEQPYDLNSWQESETALALADTLDEDAVIVEGYAEYATWRPHLAYLRDPYGDPDMEMEIDGVGGVSILAKARVFRSGVHFPAFSFEKHAETEGFGKMAKRMGFSVVGLPHYTIWHLYEPSVDDIRHMEEMEQERRAREEEEKERQERMRKIESDFDVGGQQQWEKDKSAVEEAKAEGKRADREEEERRKGVVQDGGVKGEEQAGEVLDHGHDDHALASHDESSSDGSTFPPEHSYSAAQEKQEQHRSPADAAAADSDAGVASVPLSPSSNNDDAGAMGKDSISGKGVAEKVAAAQAKAAEQELGGDGSGAKVGDARREQKKVKKAVEEAKKSAEQAKKDANLRRWANL